MKINVANFEIGTGRAFVIAEIGNNHNGDFDRAIQLIDLAVEVGADCAKFQMRQLDEVYRQRTLRKDGEDLGTEYVLDLLRRFELTVDQHRQLAQYCAKKGILYLCTPWDARSVDVLESIGVPAYKVASADLTNLPLLDRLIATKKPLILSTGMSTREEVQITVDFLNARHAPFVLLHCNSTYPAPLHDINLRWMDKLLGIHPLVGYSGHERGTAVTLAAVGLGACVVERHFTLSRGMEGPDHAASLEPAEFKRLVDGVREIEQALGDGSDRTISQGEMINRENLGKSLVSSRALETGTVIGPEHVQVRSPGQGLSPQFYEKLLGRTLKRSLNAEDFFFPSDLKDERIEPRLYKFSRPWGVPVRYHDFAEYHQRIKPDLFEFHLSYSDMELRLDDYLQGTYVCGFVVHAPELFANSRLMDLASPDEAYRTQSILETQRVINITRDLKRFFPNTPRPAIVANIGGFTMDDPLPAEVIPEYYQRFAQSLGELDLDGVELIPQTMAPFPWHFGGQRYQNIFVKIDEIVEWCHKLNLRMCFDISHTRLTCNHLGIDFYDFAERIAPISAHLHLGDAQGLNGEGLQVGAGDIDFIRLGEILRKGCPQASFIPEIWQGHKNGGEGFWVALERLEGVL
ncbi:N-acetylneuraminate synthase family protein [Rhodoferax saidenbachensis]|uniref:Acetylneuraminic acid synthetase n=1 Tax=Rhodoferax saidenbachensis TaxID=1484693 RepID=A0A1P8KDY9_9BURK|nr:N-acetylneuraminate synthase family protein [Rhodoferax saidenbachensis]APW44192.1 acetylneuraminic acid synthetase [Rhodoferax saidenbachensis]